MYIVKDVYSKIEKGVLDSNAQSIGLLVLKLYKTFFLLKRRNEPFFCDNKKGGGGAGGGGVNYSIIYGSWDLNRGWPA